VSGQTRGHNSVKSQPIFKTFSLEDSLVNLQYSRCQKLHYAPHMLPCETLMSENKRLTINYEVV